MIHALTASLFTLLLLTPAGPGWLGVFLGDSDRAVVSEVIPGSPAQKAGLQGGDVLLAVGDDKTATREDLIRVVQGLEPGAKVRLLVERDNREIKIAVTLGERPANPGAGTVEAQEPPRPTGSRRGQSPPRPPVPAPAPRAEAAPSSPRGLDAQAGQGERAGEGRGFLGLSILERDGLLAVERAIADGPAAEAGFEEGDRIVAIGDRSVRNLADLDRAMRGLRPGQSVAITTMRGDSKRSTTVRLGSRPGAGSEIESTRRAAIERPSQGASGVAPILRIRQQAAELDVPEVPETEATAAEVTEAEVTETEVTETEVVEVLGGEVVVPTEPAPQHGQQEVAEVKDRPRIRWATPGDRAAPVQGRDVVPSRGADRPDRPERANRASGANRELRIELQQLRQELRQLRLLLERMRREGRLGGEATEQETRRGRAATRRGRSRAGAGAGNRGRARAGARRGREGGGGE
ncbi:MAG: PDZ domain-containing protein [Planctomycetota bacterium]